MRRSVARTLAVALLLATPTMVTPRPPAGAVGPTVLTLELNVLGLIGTADGRSREAGVNYVLGLMAEHQPLVVALNEICYRQFDAIRAFVAAAGWTYASGYRVAFRRVLVGDDADGCASYADPSSHSEYGNAVFLRFTPQASPTGHYYSQQAGDGSRNMVCATSTVLLYTYRACATHLSTDADVRPSQRDENAWILSSVGGVVHGAGDYNQGRSLINGTPLDTAFWEADGSTPKRATADGGSAIDYVFGRGDTMTRVGNASISGDLWFTDHRLVSGTFQLY